MPVLEPESKAVPVVEPESEVTNPCPNSLQLLHNTFNPRNRTPWVQKIEEMISLA